MKGVTMSNEISMIKFYEGGGMAELRIKHNDTVLGATALYEFSNDIARVKEEIELVDDMAVIRCVVAAEKRGFILVENL